MSDIQHILKLLSQYKFDCTWEKRFQDQVEQVLKDNNIAHNREYQLKAGQRIDFLVDGSIGIEIKIKGSAKKIYRQCRDYCENDVIKEFIILTTRSMGFPKDLHGKPCYMIRAGRAWL